MKVVAPLFWAAVLALIFFVAAGSHTNAAPPPSAPVTVSAPAPVVAPKPRRYSQDSTDKWLKSCNEKGLARLKKAKKLSDQTKWLMGYSCACSMDLMEDKGEAALTPKAWNACVQQGATAYNEQVERRQRELAAQRAPANGYYYVPSAPSRGRGGGTADDYDRGEEDGYNDAPRRGNSEEYRQGYEDGQDEDDNGNLPGEEGYEEE
jgi:hypothetical protein